MGRIIAINISEKRGTFKVPVDSEVYLKCECGIEGDAHAGNWHRQISLLALESVDKMTALGVKDLTPGKFAENITTEGINLYTLPVGTRLTIGTAEVEVTQIGKECHQHCQIYHQVGMCIMPTEGIFVKVSKDGTAKVGDPINIISKPITALVLIASDKGYSGTREDLSGPAIKQALEGVVNVLDIDILPDDRTMLSDYMRAAADNGKADIIFTSGGTGFAPRDVTPEATLDVAERLVPGIPEVMRAKSLEITDRAMLSRAVACIRKRTLIINLPGSPKAVKECIDVIIGALPHAVETLRGESFECATIQG